MSSYIINRSDGVVVDNVLEGLVSNVTDLQLIGKNVPNYGKVLNDNLVKLLENFANSSPPSKPLRGELWYDTQAKCLKVFNDTWHKVGQTSVAPTTAQPTEPISGDFWFNTSTQQLFVYDSEFKVVGPETAEGFLTTRLQSATVVDNAQVRHPIIKGVIDGRTLFVISSSDFTVNGIAGFSDLKRGINLTSDFEFVGQVAGNAATSTKLQTARKINGVNFDGTSDITVTSATPNKLMAGRYMVGSDFNGMLSAVWSVDATPAGVANTVVARDEAGNFEGSTIYASVTLVGNLTGNVTGNLTGNVIGNMTGNSDTASKLHAPRKINGVDFDGSSDITISANTTGTLTRGNYIIGADFNGSNSTTWSVNATPANIANTVVARDANGNLIANSVTAHVFGDVSGNTTGNHKGNVIANDDSVAYNATTKQFTGNVTGNLTGNVAGNVVGNLTGNVNGNLTGNVTGTVTGSLVGNAATAGKLQTAKKINDVPFDGTADITVRDPSKLPLAGGTLTGHLTLGLGDPVADNHAASKRYVDTKDAATLAAALAAIGNQPNYVFTSGTQTTVSFTNQVGSWNDNANFFDVYPPAGKTMTNLVAFIPSIAQIHFAGGVNGDDSMRCTWANMGTKIRVYVQNTEQRSYPAANWLAIWR